YRVDEVLNGTDVTVTGRTYEVSGSFTTGGDSQTLEASKLVFDPASIASDTENPDAYFRDEAMRTPEQPPASFAPTAPGSLDAAPPAGDVVTAEATGELTLAGQTRTVTASVEVSSDGATARVDGSIPITFADFGVEAPSLGFVSVEDSGSV